VVHGVPIGFAHNEDVVDAINAVTNTDRLVTYEKEPLPIAADVSEERFQSDHGPFEWRDLVSGFTDTVATWRRAGALWRSLDPQV
jgi:hypothetical protein